MPIISDALLCGTAPTTLLVFLPGAYDTPQDFVDKGFVRAVRERGFDVDIQLADAHRGYYSQRKLLERLEADVMEPARAKGYRSIWFFGISLGGYGSLLYAMTHPDSLEGLVVLAPYLGDPALPLEIEGQGGLQVWRPGTGGGQDAVLWAWLKGYADPATRRPQTYLGFGSGDRFAQPNGVLAQALQPVQRFVLPGGHDWPVWQSLWSRILDVAPWPRLAARQTPCSARAG
ncbi:MAG: alpha/beta hydrolase [Polaromonas sp.]|nr:alpha/beta hydrolase [Polaromonas sp.]